MKKLFTPILVLVVLFSSCGRSGFAGDIPIGLRKPNGIMIKLCDPAFDGKSSGPQHIINVQIVQDTVLVIQSQISASDSNHFVAFSINSFRCLGSFVSCGRGPEELLSPYLPSTNPSVKCLYANDNSLGKTFGIDVMNSIKTKRGVFPHVAPLPCNTIDWIPLSPVSQLTFGIKDKELLFQMIDTCGNTKELFNPFAGLDANRYMTELSFLLTANENTGQVAMPMVCFPLVLFLDTTLEQIRAIAVNKAFRKWETILNSPFDKSSIQYYAGVASSSDLIFASYWDCSIEKAIEGGHGASIHVFNWQGDFLYEVQVKEDIGPMTYDPRTRYLYGVDLSEDIIVRYDLFDMLN